MPVTSRPDDFWDTAVKASACLGVLRLFLGAALVLCTGESVHADGLLDEAPERARQLLSDETKLLESLDALDDKLNRVSQSLRKTREEKKAWQLAFDEAEARYQKVSRDVRALTKRLKARLRTRRRLKLDSIAWRQLLFSSATVNDLIRQRGYLSSILGHDLRLVNELTDAALNAQDAAEQRRTSMEEMKKTEKNLARQRDALEQERSVQFEVLRQIRERKTLMDVVIARRAGWRRLLSANEKELKIARASLPWPIQGSLRRTFGVKRDPKTGAVTRHGGWLIRGRNRERVRSIMPGRVAYSGQFGSFGHVLIIAHSERFHSVYAHLGQRTLQEGDDVRRGQLVGRLAETTSSARPSLYFELRIDQKVVNPQKWLRKSP